MYKDASAVEKNIMPWVIRTHGSPTTKAIFENIRKAIEKQRKEAHKALFYMNWDVNSLGVLKD